MTLAEIPGIGEAIKGVSDCLRGLVGIWSEATLDKDAKAQLNYKAAELQAKLAELQLQAQIRWMELTAQATWKAVLIYASGAVILAMMVNNCIVLPYFPGVQALPIPVELWSVFGGLIGIDVLEKLAKKKAKGGET